MQFLVHHQMNILSALVVFLFGIYVVSVLDKKTLINKIYTLSLILSLLLIIIEIIVNVLLEAKVGLIWAKISAYILYFLIPVFYYIFLRFVCSYFQAPYKLRKPVRPVFKLLMVINALVGLFYINNKEFGSSEFFNLSFPLILSQVFLLYSLYVLISNKKMLLKCEYAYILAISSAANLMVFAQLLFSQTRFILSGTTFTIIMMFIIIQQRELYRDSLTGTRNRIVLRRCLDSFVKRPSKSLSVIMIDLDYFKDINDSYGHIEGDNALKIFARLLQKVFHDKGMVIRMGGDEFIVLLFDISYVKLNDLIAKMDKMVEKYNIRCGKPYMLKYSYASGTYNNDMGMGIDQFIHEVDMKMYSNKNNRKRKVWNGEMEF